MWLNKILKWSLFSELYEKSNLQYKNRFIYNRGLCNIYIKQQSTHVS